MAIGDSLGMNLIRLEWVYDTPDHESNETYLKSMKNAEIFPLQASPRQRTEFI